jgi:hypothetical protein
MTMGIGFGITFGLPALFYTCIALITVTTIIAVVISNTDSRFQASQESDE